MLDDAEAEHAVERAFVERQVEEVGLREVESVLLAEVGARSVDRGRRVHRPDLRACVEQNLREASRPAAELEHALALQVLGPARPLEEPRA